MRVVVTGSSGSIGSAVVAAFRARGDDVVGIDVAASAGEVAGDVSVPGAWTDALDGADLVVHTAAVVAESGDPTLFWRVNVEGTRRVLEAAADAGAGRVVHLSSIVVYGARPPDGVDETAPVRMTGGPYTDTKVAAEHQAIAVALRRGLPLTVVRPGDVYGPGVRAWTVRPLELIARRVLVAVPAGGILSPVHLDDVVSGIVSAGTTPAAAGEIVNLTGSGAPAVEFLRRYGEALGVRVRALPEPAVRGLVGAIDRAHRLVGRTPPVSVEGIEYVSHRGTYANHKARELLGWEPRVGLDEGMRRTLTWARDAGLVPAAPE